MRRLLATGDGCDGCDLAHAAAFDSECDLLLEAQRRPDAVRAIRDFRNRLLAEHLGIAEERLATEIDAQGSMSAAMDRLGSPQRTLKRLSNTGVSETGVSLASIADPEQPVTIVGVVAGAIGVELLDFMLATAFGMLPGTLAATVFGDQLEVALRGPGAVSLWLIAAVLMALGIATLLVRRWLLTTQLHGESTRA